MQGITVNGLPLNLYLKRTRLSKVENETKKTIEFIVAHSSGPRHGASIRNHSHARTSPGRVVFHREDVQ